MKKIPLFPFFNEVRFDACNITFQNFSQWVLFSLRFHGSMETEMELSRHVVHHFEVGALYRAVYVLGLPRKILTI